jgi:hypothetical protein
MSIVLRTNGLIQILSMFYKRKNYVREDNMKASLRHLKKFTQSKYAMALPVTFLILFVSTLSIVSFTYYFSVEKVNSQGQTLKVSTAKESLISLNNEIISTLGQPGSSTTYDLIDSGGLLKIQPTSNVLTLSINDGFDIEEIILSTSIGKITYQLPYSSTSQIGLYLEGDSRTITNQSGSSTSQLYIASGAEHQEIQLQYRPTVTYSVAGLENGKVINTVRIYVVNLNSSSEISLKGELPLKISCTNTLLELKNYEVSNDVVSLSITSVLNGVRSSVSVPISSTTEGAIIHLETVCSNVSIQRWIR